MVEKNTILPQVLLHSQKIIGLKWTSKKVAEKSLEHGCLWEVHPLSHKEVMVEPQIKVSSIQREAACYVAILDEHTELSMLKKMLEAQEQDFLANVSASMSFASKDLHFKKEQSNNQTREDNTQRATLDDAVFQNLAVLTQTIEHRKQQMPEGSYTTHLFKSGGEKIRKKLGEEAIEIILAKSPDEIVQESADFLYHLFVLYAQEKMDIRQVMQVLAERNDPATPSEADELKTNKKTDSEHISTKVNKRRQ